MFHLKRTVALIPTELLLKTTISEILKKLNRRRTEQCLLLTRLNRNQICLLRAYFVTHEGFFLHETMMEVVYQNTGTAFEANITGSH